LRPTKIPRRTRQILVDDITETWNAFDHNLGVVGHKQTGCTLALDGSEDHLIYHDLLPWWNELGMAKVREDICLAEPTLIIVSNRQVCVPAHSAPPLAYGLVLCT
jgi:hypothetical protein